MTYRSLFYWLVPLSVWCGWQSTKAATFPFPSPSTELVGQLTYVIARHEDTLVDIARKHSLGYQEIRLANPDVDPWLPGEGTKIVLPTRYLLPDAPRKGIIINRAEMRLYYYPKSPSGQVSQVITFPVGIGRVEWETPLAMTAITGKVADPAWYPPASIRAEYAESNNPLPAVVPPGPDNPLGRFALRLGLAGYLIHGSNKPYGVGMRVSHGCIRLYTEDIEVLFGSVPVGTPVQIINQPFKAGWAEDELYLEVHPTGDDTTPPTAQDLTSLVRILVAATRERPEYGVNWDKVEKIALSARGIPIAVSGREDEPVVVNSAVAPVESTFANRNPQ
ncbi:MAG: L,D-transpeptidase family protein [Gammaproteobacteria bacterium]